MNLNFNTSQALPPEQLILLGKTAAQTAETSGMSLTDAVVRAIGMTKLNEQQVRRVVEAANHEAFHRKFASMETHMRVVELEGGPADPSAVIERLALAALPTKSASATSDYTLAPRYNSEVPRGPYSDGMTKAAALQPVYGLEERLRASHEELSGNLAARQGDVEVATQKLAFTTRQAVAEGAFYEDLERAWGSMNPKVATEMLSVMRLPRAPAGVKTASRLISESAPVRTAFAHFVKVAHDYEVACEAVRAVEQEMIKVSDFLRSAR